jgi:hypothetical protein
MRFNLQWWLRVGACGTPEWESCRDVGSLPPPKMKRLLPLKCRADTENHAADRLRSGRFFVDRNDLRNLIAT